MPNQPNVPMSQISNLKSPISGKTFAEKALARAAGQREVVAGQIVDATPDVALSHDNTEAIAIFFMRSASPA
jgi:homoaconitase/3-isopropylmalate dehydratase large subunit